LEINLDKLVVCYLRGYHVINDDEILPNLIEEKHQPMQKEKQRNKKKVLLFD
jgi:hypothetical protein